VELLVGGHVVTSTRGGVVPEMAMLASQRADARRSRREEGSRWYHAQL
jgi:hypothetical protein